MKTKIFRSFLIFIFAAGGFFIFGKNSFAATIDHLVISEIQVAGATANDEFIEIYNPTTNAIDIENWSIQYKSATGTTFYKKNFSTGASVPAHGWYLVAHNDYAGATTPDMTQSTFSMAGAGGHIFLVSNQTTLTSATDPSIVDKVGYGTADLPEGTAAPAPPASQSIERKFGGDLGNGEDTDDNSADFDLQITPNPQNTSSPPKPDLPGPVCGNAICEISEDELTCPADCLLPSTEPGVGDVVINEFVSDPLEDEEWIELYNKKNFDIDLTGWKLEDGVGVIATLSGTLTASGNEKFKVFEMTSNKLNNNGDIIILKKSDGTIIDQVAYGNWDDGNTADNAPKASDPNSTARKTDGADTDNDSSDFALTSTLTKGTTNIITAPPSLPGSSSPLESSPSPSPPSWPVGSLLINEFVADPTDGNDEWIELYNPTASLITLNNWTIEDGSETVTALSGSIASLSFFVLEKPKGILNNTGDIIILKDPAGLIIDQVTYGDWDDGEKSDNAPAAADPNSVARKIDGQDTNNDFNDFVVATPTLGTTNAGGLAQNVDIAYSRDIIINEVLPNPKGDDSQNEFIEFKNIGTTDIDLTNWKIGDASTKTYTIKTIDFASTIIKPNEFFILYRKTTNIALNNTGTEAVKLYGPDGALVVSIEYSDPAAENQSYARDGENYFWTTTPTPGKENIINRKNQPPTAVISTLTEAEIGEAVIFDGSDSTDPENDALTFFWNFGDKKTAKGPTVSHTYATKGKFKVILSVKDSAGSTDTAEIYITVIDPDTAKNFTSFETPFIIINEIIPNPEGSDDAEWVELWNAGTTEIDLTDWKLDDDEGGSRPYKIPKDTTIGPGEYLVFKKEITKLAFNNTYDAARLMDPAGDIIFEISYDEVIEGASYARTENGAWKWTTTLTPGAKNIFTFQEKSNIKKSTTKTSSSKTSSTTKYIETTLEEIREQDLGDKIKVKGQVIVEPGVLGSQIFYIANEEACPGIQIYMYNKDFPELKLGDYVEILGILSETGGEKRIKVAEKSHIIILENKEVPAPLLIKLSEIEESLEGCLVSASGEITEKSGSNWYFDDGEEESKIYFKSSLPFAKPKIDIGEQLEVAGIISQTKTGFRLLPRYEADIKIKTPQVEQEQQEQIEMPKNEKPKNILGILGAAAGILGLTLLGLSIKTGILSTWWKKIKGL